jgi:hypothetical protein
MGISQQELFVAREMVRNALQSGRNIEDIKKALISAGYPERMVEEIIRKESRFKKEEVRTPVELVPDFQKVFDKAKAQVDFAEAMELDLPVVKNINLMDKESDFKYSLKNRSFGECENTIKDLHEFSENIGDLLRGVSTQDISMRFDQLGDELRELMKKGQAQCMDMNRYRSEASVLKFKKRDITRSYMEQDKMRTFKLLANLYNMVRELRNSLS